MPLLVLRHVDAHERRLVVEQLLGERLRQLGLADAGRAQKDERAERPVALLQPGPGPADGVGHGLDGLGLADDALADLVLQVEQLGAFGLQHLRDRDAGRARDHVRDVLGVDLLLEHRAALLHLGERARGGGDGRFQGRDLAVADLGHLAKVALALQVGGLRFERVDLGA